MNENTIQNGASLDAVCALPNLAVVIPCFNEQDGIGLLATNLFELEKQLSRDYQPEFVLVDDGSTDSTLQSLKETFAQYPRYGIVEHGCNRGIAAAICTGIRSTQATIVCSIDADCSYDPAQLTQLLALIDDDISVVTASPYHPRGSVVGVTGWRLGLSKFASKIYAKLFVNKLHTYTSCFRAYRRESVCQIDLSYPGFVGVTEMLWQVDRQGHRIIEAPAVLTSRRFGVSKMNVMRSGLSHLGLMSKIIADTVARQITRIRVTVPGARSTHNVDNNLQPEGDGKNQLSPGILESEEVAQASPFDQDERPVTVPDIMTEHQR